MSKLSASFLFEKVWSDMEKTDLLEIKKLFKYPDCSFGKLGFAVISSLDHDDEEAAERVDYVGESKFLTRDDEEQKSFLTLLNKAFCFQESVSSCDVKVSGDLKKILSSYALCDNDVSFNLMPFVTELVKSYGSIKSYALVFFKGSYDIPIKDVSKTKTGESEDVYKYIAIMLCPIEASKVGLCPKDGDIKRGDIVRILKQPVFGLIYPSFTDRASDDEHAFVCCKKEAERTLVSNLFNEDVPEPEKKVKVQIKEKAMSSTSAAEPLELGEVPVYTDVSDASALVNENVKKGSSFSSESISVDKVHSSLYSYDDKPEVNDIDSALLKKRSEHDEEEFTQEIEVKEDKSSLSHNKVTERDIGGKKFFIIPKDLLPADILEKILQLEA